MYKQTNNPGWRCWPFLLLSLPLLAQGKAAAALPDYSLVLAGGGLRSCSSMSPAQCQPGQHFAPELAKTAERYAVTDAALQRIAQASWWLPARAALRDQTVQLLRDLHLAQPSTAELPTGAQLRERWQAIPAGAALYQALAASELDFIFDELEQPVLDSRQQRLPERVNLSAGLDSGSRQVYETITGQAAKVKKTGKKPRILVVTASSRDPFAAVDYYLDLFRQTGGRTAPEVQWLPLTAAYQAAQRQQAAGQPGCAALPALLRDIHRTVNRAAVYPDLFAQQLRFCQQGPAAAVALINSADAIFFNGGDQSLTWQALRQPDGADTPELLAIRQAVRQGRLIVAGTSAGTAVQAGGQWQGRPVPMISNGTSAHALLHGALAAPAPAAGCQQNNSCPPGVAEQQLTYQPLGGLGLFPFGLLDTHFSERGREFRLIRLLSDTGSRFGFGVDEASALLVGFDNSANQRARLSVVGAAGVFIADLQQADSRRPPHSGSGRWQISGVQTHYLASGQQASLSPAGVQLTQAVAAGQPATLLQPARQPTTQPTMQPTMQPLAVGGNVALAAAALLQQDHYRQLTQQLCRAAATQASGQAAQWQVQINKTSQSRQITAAGGTTEPMQPGCSYQNFLLQISG